jgi:hypothetical protein
MTLVSDSALRDVLDRIVGRYTASAEPGDLTTGELFRFLDADHRTAKVSTVLGHSHEIVDVRVGVVDGSVVPFELRAWGRATLSSVGGRPVHVEYEFNGPGAAVASDDGLKVYDLTIGGRLFSRNWLAGNGRTEAKASGLSATLVGVRRGVHCRAYVRIVNERSRPTEVLLARVRATVEGKLQPVPTYVVAEHRPSMLPITHMRYRVPPNSSDMVAVGFDRSYFAGWQGLTLSLRLLPRFLPRFAQFDFRRRDHTYITE